MSTRFKAGDIIVANCSHSVGDDMKIVAGEEYVVNHTAYEGATALVRLERCSGHPCPGHCGWFEYIFDHKKPPTQEELDMAASLPSPEEVRRAIL